MDMRVVGRWLAPALLWLLVLGAVVLGLVARSQAVAARVLQTRAATEVGITEVDAAGVVAAGGAAEATVTAWVLAAGGVPTATSAVRIATATDAGGVWDVLVAATIAVPADPGDAGPSPLPVQRTFVVSIDDSLSAVGPPAEVAAADLGVGEVDDVGGSLDDLPDDAAITITGFLEGLLAGGEALDRYVTPDSTIGPVQPAPFESVTVDGVVVHTSDGTDATVTVHAVGHASSMRSQRLQYELQLRHGSRWEVVAIVNYPDKDTEHD